MFSIIILQASAAFGHAGFTVRAEMCVHYGTVLTCYAYHCYCGSVQGSYKFSSSLPSNTAPLWLLESAMPRFRGLGTRR